jgi:hypothetical protein
MGMTVTSRAPSSVGWALTRRTTNCPGRILRAIWGASMVRLIRSRFVNTDYVYQTQFQVPASFSGRRIWLNFEGISRNAIVFVNGTKVGVIHGVWTRGKFDITSYVTAKGANGLAVIIRKGTSADASILLAGQRRGGPSSGS